ncbi:GNAT family N-acetyltransferase [Streptomyces sp. 549]|uniref:GNAT family N-acetyltransferase n=1 Tax=Streptomyces sp. 549 TaxID=3049076 RepID=UPI0024C30C72|nr:GNAT family N-acetyltransferase [Streptomyces sp. 549]MDK1473928.1 GNAT family N-acetyltransferase [Streptomyces sp. 549]
MTTRTAVVPLPEIFALRWEVLRPGLPAASAEFAEDAEPGAFHIAAYDGDRPRVLACGSFYPEGFPDPGGPGGTGFRIRGMASAAHVRGRGYGAAVLAAGTAQALARGADVVWCNGRTEAGGFYRRHGYRTFGPEFVIPGVGPHFVFVRELGAAAG